MLSSSAPGFDGTDLFALTLAVKVHAPEGLPLPPYTVDVRSIGYFQYREDSAEETPAEQLNRIVSVNGASLLYSGIRELVAAITARGPWGQVLLPTVDFRAIPVKVTQPEVEPASEANEADEAARSPFILPGRLSSPGTVHFSLSEQEKAPYLERRVCGIGDRYRLLGSQWEDTRSHAGRHRCDPRSGGIGRASAAGLCAARK